MGRKLQLLVYLVIFLLAGCQPATISTASLNQQTPANASPTPEICATERIPEMTSYEELENFFRSVRKNKDLDLYKNVKTEKYFRMEREVKDSKLQSITIYPGTLAYQYVFNDELDRYGQNTITFAWYREFTDGEEFLRNIWTEGVMYEEIKYKGTLYLYRKVLAPAGKNGEDIEVGQYAIWTQGDDCFDCWFPVRYSREEFLDFCKAVCKTVD